MSSTVYVTDDYIGLPFWVDTTLTQEILDFYNYQIQHYDLNCSTYIIDDNESMNDYVMLLVRNTFSKSELPIRLVNHSIKSRRVALKQVYYGFYIPTHYFMKNFSKVKLAMYEILNCLDLGINDYETLRDIILIYCDILNKEDL